MPNINIGRIMSHLASYAASNAGQRVMDNHIKNNVASGKNTTAGGGKVLTDSEMFDVAAKLIALIHSTASSCDLPTSVMAHVDGLSCSAISHLPNGSSMINISFGGDKHRDSLSTELYPEGIDNIVALFNNGYQASNSVYGWWKGHSATGEAKYDYRNIHSPGGATYIKSRISRDGTHFINTALADFNSTYGSLYNVTATASSDYGKT